MVEFAIREGGAITALVASEGRKFTVRHLPRLTEPEVFALVVKRHVKKK